MFLAPVLSAQLMRAPTGRPRVTLYLLPPAPPPLPLFDIVSVRLRSRYLRCVLRDRSCARLLALARLAIPPPRLPRKKIHSVEITSWGWEKGARPSAGGGEWRGDTVSANLDFSAQKCSKSSTCWKAGLLHPHPRKHYMTYRTKRALTKTGRDHRPGSTFCTRPGTWGPECSTRTDEKEREREREVGFSLATSNRGGGVQAHHSVDAVGLVAPDPLRVVELLVPPGFSHQLLQGLPLRQHRGIRFLVHLEGGRQP